MCNSSQSHQTSVGATAQVTKNNILDKTTSAFLNIVVQNLKYQNVIF